MKAIVLEKPGQLSVKSLKAPSEPGPEEALVRVHRVGICGTDLHAFQGRQTFFRYPRILGHELAVEVISIGKNEAALAVGDCCAVEPYLNCGSCIACRRGKPNCCVHLRVLGVHVDGGMSGQITVPSAKLHKSKTLSLDQLALVETLGVGAHAVWRAGLESGEFVLVIGAGPIGLSVIECAGLAGAEIIVMEISEKRLDFCRSVMQIQRRVEAKKDPMSQLRKILAGDLPTAVFDCTGNPHSMMAAFDFVAHGGRLIFVGHHPGDVTFHDPDFHSRELTLLGSRNSTATDFQQVIRLMEEGEIDITPWITHRVPSTALIQTFPEWLDTEMGVIKAMVEWQEMS